MEGGGTLDGQGAAYSGPYLVRPYMIRMIGCRGVNVTDVTIRDSPMWVQHYLLCEDLNFDGLVVRSQVNRNNDGIDIDSCRRVRISNCDINSEDDAIVLKSTTATPCRDIAITNCVISSFCNAIKLGTESNGGFQNISISNCTVYDTLHAGIALECVDGGTLDRVNVSNIVMHGVQCPIFLRLGDRARPFQQGQARPPVGYFRNVIISDIQAMAAGKNACSITGLPERPLENVVLANINLEFLGGGTSEQTTREIPEEREHYPEHSMYGVLPAYAFYFRHARGLTVENVRVATRKPDLRHAIVFSDVEDLALRNLRAQAEPGAEPVILMDSVRDVHLSGCRAPKQAAAFLKVTGKSSAAIALTGNDLSAAKTPVELDPALPKTTVRTI
ncbi:MAG: glycosyl hydrolase family 28 protein [Acidobacteria bacterium]|nr:glycosyl hydrolase family 28 protein [Acidobacteriota bacterium]